MWRGRREQEEERACGGSGEGEKTGVRKKTEEPERRCSDCAGGGHGCREASQHPAEQKVNDIKAKTVDILIPGSSCFSEDSNED